MNWHAGARSYWRTKLTCEMNEKYEKWLADIRSIPTPYQFLTEEQWDETCRYFKTCALCDNDDIAARGMFIHLQAGGAYTQWNILPICERCATEFVKQHNPFRRINERLNSNLNMARGLSSEKLNKAAEYLHSKMGVEDDKK